MTTVESIKAVMATFETEDAKFTGGNASAGARARKALSELAKLAKVRRAEITDEKNARKEAK
jgi:hypothetical protein